MNLGEWLKTWLELYVEPSGLAKNTKLCYNRAVRSLMSEDSLSSIPLPQLSPLDLRRWLLSVARETPRAAQLDRVMLSRALTVAAKLGLCRAGMVDQDVCPQIVHRPAKAAVLTAEQLRRYMVRAAHEKCASVLLLCCCGCRRGEAMGARWCDIDLAAGTFTITVQRQSHDPLPLKSRSAHRTIALPPMVMTAIRAQPASLPWVCSCCMQDVYAAHRRVIEAEDLPHVTLHGLRHSVATIAVMAGEPIKLIQAALGHSRYQLTADLYADHMPPVATMTARILEYCAHDN